MDLSTIGIYRCRHHFNVCMINSSINTENIPPSNYGGFVWAYAPVRPIAARSNRAYGCNRVKAKGFVETVTEKKLVGVSAKIDLALFASETALHRGLLQVDVG